jgi:hypothetical protein
MNDAEILDHLARLDMDVEEVRRDQRRLDIVGQLARENYSEAINERDRFVVAIRHHRLTQAHNSEVCPLCEPAWKPAPIDRRCPACNAAPGRPCTAPTDASRRPVGWYHLSREAE